MELSTTNTRPFPIVGVGTSAGARDALEALLKGIPAVSGVAIVIVTPVAHDRKSLHDIVSGFTALQVHTAAELMTVEVNRVYVVPGTSMVSLEGGRLRLGPVGEAGHDKNPIDTFFLSLAMDQQQYAAGVLLFATGVDGMRGITSIKEHGGLTLASTGEACGPRFAAGLFDCVMPIADMGARLERFAMTVRGSYDNITSADSHLKEIFDILESQVGYDFSDYKQDTVLRRVLRRLQVRQIQDLAAYVDVVRQDATEVAALFRDLLLHVTAFFKDTASFSSLRDKVIPTLFEPHRAEHTIRVWIAGCSTGEEAYSIAMLMREHADSLPSAPAMHLFATDIDEHAIEVARRGRYPAALVDCVAPQRRARFFSVDGEHLVVCKAIRQLCTFAVHSVIRDPPFSSIDLIACRNVFSHFAPAAQEHASAVFRYALKSNGYVFLGAGESLGHFSRSFEAIDAEHRIYRKIADDTQLPRLPALPRRPSPWKHADEFRLPPIPAAIVLDRAVQHTVLHDYAPPYVVVDPQGNIVSSSQRVARYLDCSAETAGRALFTVAQHGLERPLRSALRDAIQTGKLVTINGIAVPGKQIDAYTLSISVAPLEVSERFTEAYYIVMFHEQGPSGKAAPGPSTRHVDVDTLDRELKEVHRRLRSRTEEYEIAIEELRSSNEELLSANEELESSKEELRSVNAELQLVNSDLLEKVHALDRAHGDLENLFQSTDVATVFLDKNRFIRSFTPVLAQIFHILPTDRGRPITDLCSRLSLPGFADDIGLAYSASKVIERRVEHESSNAHFLMRIAPYRNASQVIEGVVVNFTRVSTLSLDEVRQHVVVAELQHRTRNLLTVVQSIATQTLPDDARRTSYLDRLSALGRVQSLISQELEDRINIAEMLQFELYAHGVDTSNRVTASGPRVTLDRNRVQTLALALHELTTNALKYGAFRYPAGRLAVTWDLVKDGDRGDVLSLTWQESGVPMAGQEHRKGYGHTLITESIPYNLRAKTALKFGADGIRCHIEVPLELHPGKRLP